MGKLFQNLFIFIITILYQQEPCNGFAGKNENGSGDKALPRVKSHRSAARIALRLIPPILT